LTTGRSNRNPFIKGYCINREYSWLMFNERVLDQAMALENPLLERCKFLSIFSSNLDEFFMVRVGSLLNQQKINPKLRENKTNLTAEEQINGILKICKKLYVKKNEIFEQIRLELKEKGINLLLSKDLTDKQSEICKKYFIANVLPLMSPFVLDAKHPMIHFENLRNYIVYELEMDGRTMYGLMAINPRLEQVFQIPAGEGINLIPLEEIVSRYGFIAFPGYKVRGKALVRVTRNADFDANVEDADIEHDFDFSKFIKSKVKLRGSMEVVRLETDCSKSTLREFLFTNLDIRKQFSFRLKNFFDDRVLMLISKYIPSEIANPLKYIPFRGAEAEEITSSESLMELVREKDIFLSYPYDSMDPLVRLLNECVDDSRVMSIRMTIYRVDMHSRIVDALIRASEKGKDIEVMFELSARFDEENNLYYADLLQQAGCEVSYGYSNYKVHSKILSIVMYDGKEPTYITHFGTGNYNEDTSRLYTDLNVITSNRSIGEDAAAFFRNIGVGNLDYKYDKMLLAPTTFKKGIISYIEREIEKAKLGKPAIIVAKMNSLTDKDIIDKLVVASKEGVRIKLIVRGICCILPGIEGVTENITVMSIVGRLLEHSRIYSFGDEEDRIIYISSADLMTRNTDRRVEIATPILDKEIEKEISAYLDLMLKDTQKARWLGSDGSYYRVESDEPFDAQQFLINETMKGGNL